MYFVRLRYVLRKAQLINRVRTQKLNRPIVRKHFEEVKNFYDKFGIVIYSENFTMKMKRDTGRLFKSNRLQSVLYDHGGSRPL